MVRLEGHVTGDFQLPWKEDSVFQFSWTTSEQIRFYTALPPKILLKQSTIIKV